MTLREDFVFSQSNLQDFRDCPRRFQHRYIEHLRWPAPQTAPIIEQEELLERGANFHHLIHQHVLGVPAELLTRQIHDDTLREWWQTYLEWDWLGVPEQREAEVELSVPILEWRLMAKYDVLAIEPGKKAVIIDWKTSRKMPKKDVLKDKMQTIIYPYVLAQAGETLNGGKLIKPENIEMRYWYPAENGKYHTFAYDAGLMEDAEAELTNLVQDIAARAANEFPMTDDLWKCKFCEYRSKCDRGREAGSIDELEDYEGGSTLEDFDINLDQIAEVEF